MLKVFIACVFIAIMESLAEKADADAGRKRDKFSAAMFELGLSVLMGAWIISGGNLLW